LRGWRDGRAVAVRVIAAAGPVVVALVLAGLKFYREMSKPAYY
jgi:hypothetical protein